MCVDSTPFGSAAPKPPPPPAPTRPPKGPTKADPAVKRAKTAQRSKLKRAAGRQSTLLGGALTEEPENVARKTLLGA